MYADENVIKIKHAVLLEVAKAAFAGNLDEIRDDIPFTLIPGPTPQFRCCIRTVLARLVSMPVSSEQSRQDVSAHISTHRSVRSVDAVHRHVLTTLSLI